MGNIIATVADTVDQFLERFRGRADWPATTAEADVQIAAVKLEIPRLEAEHSALELDDAAAPLDAKGQQRLDRLVRDLKRARVRLEALDKQRWYLSMQEAAAEREARITHLREVGAVLEAKLATLQKAVDQVAKDAAAVLEGADEYRVAAQGLTGRDFDPLYIHRELSRRMGLALFVATGDTALRPENCPLDPATLKNNGWASLPDLGREWTTIAIRGLDEKPAEPEAPAQPQEEPNHAQ